MPESQDVIGRVREVLTHKNEELLWGGVALAVLGAAALVFPVAATFAVALMIGWLLVLSGVVTIWDAFTVEGTGPFFGELLVGLLKLAFGVYLFRHTNVSVVALTLLLAAIFAASRYGCGWRHSFSRCHDDFRGANCFEAAEKPDEKQKAPARDQGNKKPGRG